jgi:hypothetical protein
MFETSSNPKSRGDGSCNSISLIAKQVADGLSLALLQGAYTHGDTIIVEISNDELVFSKTPSVEVSV